MSLFFESWKPILTEGTIKKWRENALKMRKILEGKDVDCRELRNKSRRMRYEVGIDKTWSHYYNNMRLHDRIYEIEVLISYAEEILPATAKEKKLVEDEKFLTEMLLQKCDTWIGTCMEGLNSLDRKLDDEQTRDDEGWEETKKEIKLLEDFKQRLKDDCLLAWEMSSKLEDIETRIDLNLEFKREVLAIDQNCQAIDKMDTDVSYKVEPTKGPKKMITIEEWSKAVYNLVEKGQTSVLDSMKLREKMLATREVCINEYCIQFDKTDYALRKRIYEINREKNDCQYQLLRVEEMMAVTKAEWIRIENFLQDVKDDLRCAETRCTERYFRPSVDATADPPFTGLNQEVIDLNAKVEEIEDQLDALKAYYNRLEEDGHELFKASEAKNKSLQIQVQALDIRIAGRYDPKKVYAYKPELLMSKMVSQLPPFFSLYSDHY